MSRVVGAPEDLALSGWDGDSEDPVFALGDFEADADVRFATGGNGRLVAPAGDGLWRRAPWPVRDALLEMEAPADPRRVLVAGADGEIADHLRGIGVAVDERKRLDVDALRDAAIVVLTGGDGALHRHAMCVLAARRILVTNPGEVTFGLQPGIEFLAAPSTYAAIELANMAAVHPQATTALAVLGARAAREHRASLVYPRLAADLP